MYLQNLQDKEVYVPYVRGLLQPEMDRELWINPGDRYAVEVVCEDPCLEMTLRQVRTCNWELEPFVFYTYVTVRGDCSTSIHAAGCWSPTISTHSSIDEVRAAPPSVSWHSDYVIYSPLACRLNEAI